MAPIIGDKIAGLGPTCQKIALIEACLRTLRIPTESRIPAMPPQAMNGSARHAEALVPESASAAHKKECSLPLPTRIAFIGNYLPRECGIATFTTDLCTAVAAEFGEGRLFAIPVNDPESSYEYPEQVRLELAQEDLASYERAAEFLN